MKKILLFIMCVVPLFVSGEWEKFPDTENVKDKVFYINDTHKTEGLHLCAIDKDLYSYVRIRINNNIADLDCCIIRNEYSVAGNYYIQFFDEDYYFIAERNIGKVAANFTGELEDRFTGDLKTLNKIYSYKLIMRAS